MQEERGVRTSVEAPPRRTPADHDSGLFGGRYREVTWPAIILGLLLGAVMNAAITYAGLKIGFTIVGSAIAVVLGFGVLRGMLRRGSILEVNITQTIASAVNTPNSGVIFTVPVLFLLGYQLSVGDLEFWLIMLACVAGAILGGAFIIPLRKQMIDIDRLRFPSATGVAVILKSPGSGSAKSLLLVAGMVVSALVFLPVGLADLNLPGYASLDLRLSVPAEFGDGQLLPAQAGLSLREAEAQGVPLVSAWRDRDGVSLLPLELDRDQDGRPDLLLTKDRLDVGRILGIPAEMQLVFAVAPFAIGAGFLSGKAGLLVLAGGILAFFVLNPLAFRFEWVPPGAFAHEVPNILYQAVNRPLGIGLLLGGALMGILAALPAIKAALESIAKSGRAKLGADELGFKVLIAAVLSALLLLFVAADFLGNEAFNRTCPVTPADAVSALGADAVPGVGADALPALGASAARDRAPGTFAPIDEDVQTERYQGYSVGFASEEARQVWREQWGEPEREAFMARENAKPGLLSGLSPHLRALILALVGAAWIWFAGIIIAQCTGMTDWSPISGMSLLTVVLVLTLAGSGAVLSAVLLGAALCVAITCAADMMGDLKTGHLVGSQPRRQQIVEMVATGLGPIITLFVLLIIVQVNMTKFGVPIGAGTDTTAPQAQALQAVIRGVQGGEMPYALYGFGALTGVLLGLGSFAGLGVLVGLSMFLPFFYIATYGIGCVTNIVLTRVKGARWCENWGVPVAAGLIVGEALLALVINLMVLGGVNQ
jgi:uncharacterized oligopeptide transporter (OPT) family protein